MSDDNSSVTDLGGGALRVTMARPMAPAQRGNQSPDMPKGVSSIKIVSDRQSSANDASAPVPAENVLRTARSVMGPVHGRNITPDSLVRVGGLEMTAERAEAIGALRWNEQAKSYENGPGVSAGGNGNNNDDDNGDDDRSDFEKDHTPESLGDPEAEAFLAEAQARSRTELEEVASALLADDDSKLNSAIEHLASNLNLEPSEVQEYVDHTVAVLTSKAIESIDRQLPGVAEQVIAWAEENDPNGLRSAMKDHWRTQRADYSKFIMPYLADRAQNDADAFIAELSANAPDLRFEKGSSGRITVTMPDGQRLDLLGGFHSGIFPRKK